MLAWFCTGWVAGCLLTHQLAALPNTFHVFVAGAVLLGLLILARRLLFLAWLIAIICGLAFGLAWSTWSAKDRLSNALDPQLEGYVTRLTLLVTSIAKVDAHGQQFDAVLMGDAPKGVPRNIQVHWPGHASQPSSDHSHDPSVQVVMPGQVWRAALVLKRPRSKINPHLFDSEAHSFSRGIRAIGTVRGLPRLIRDEPWSSANTLVQRLRHHIRAAMLRAIGDKRYGPVLIALAVGDQNGVRSDDWKVFNLAGITHLVSISGSHVTLMAALAARLCLAGWKRARWRGGALCSRVPAKTAAGCVAMVIAFLYCLLAGWGVPAQRTFFMLLVAWLAWTSRMRLSSHQVLSVAGFVVSLLDPWSVTSTGFWLSFGAVWVLWMASQSRGRCRPERNGRWRRHFSTLASATRMQWVISLSLVPMLCWLFQQVSLASPLANAVAIPVVTLVVTPASLLLAGLSMVETLSFASSSLAWFAHAAFEWMMVPVSTLTKANWSLIEIPAFPVSLLATAVLGMAWSLQPRGVPARWAGWLWMSLALCWSPSRPGPGEWHLLALDVGQASSVLILTHQHTVLFDAGGRSAKSDDGERILLPVLRALGIKKLDLVVISHEDRDHIGGLESILKGIPVKMLVGTTSRLEFTAQRPHLTCQRGASWRMDDVRLEVLHPEREMTNTPPPQKTRKRNHQSCVLSISGKHHSVLLPGDITAKEEAKLVSSIVPRAHVVLAPHHGSDTSSSPDWVRATGAQHVIFQSGWLNRFGHPSGQVLARWEAAGAKPWRTDRQGAIWVLSQGKELVVMSAREQRRRYWHFDD